MPTKVEIIPISDDQKKEIVFHLNLACSKHQIDSFVSKEDATRYAEENNLEIVEL